MSGSVCRSGAHRSQLYEAYTPHERSRLHMPVLNSDFEAWGLPVPSHGTPLPWRTRGEFMCAVFFHYEDTRDWCLEVTSDTFSSRLGQLLTEALRNAKA